MLLPASHSVAVEDEVTVSTIELTIGGGIHRHLIAVLNAPNLKGRIKPTSPHCFICNGLKKEQLVTHSYLNLALAIIHHAVLGCHGLVRVQTGGIERHLCHFGNAADGVSLTGACSLVFVPPVTEELLKQSRLTSGRKNLDLQGKFKEF